MFIGLNVRDACVSVVVNDEMDGFGAITLYTLELLVNSEVPIAAVAEVKGNTVVMVFISDSIMLHMNPHSRMPVAFIAVPKLDIVQFATILFVVFVPVVGIASVGGLGNDDVL
jgi:hypothetical protein